MNRYLLFLLAALAFAGDLSAQITITGPAKPIQPGRMVRLLIRGITDAELIGSAATVTPPVGVSVDDIDLFPGKSWQNQPYIDFSAQSPGKYLISVDVNLWSESLTTALTAAQQAKIEADLLKELQVSVTKISGKYPAKAGQTVVEVSGTPVPPPPPPPPPNPTQGLVWTVVIRTTTTMTPDQAEVLANLRQWSDQQPVTKVAHWEFPPDAVGPGGEPDAKVAAFVQRIPAGKTQPYVFLSQARADGKATIVWHSELPKTAAEVIAKIQEYVKP